MLATDAFRLWKPNKTLPLINKEARRINCVEFDIIYLQNFTTFLP